MRTAVLITGASRGFGRCLALDFVRETESDDIDVHLWARDEAGLKETERLVRLAWDAKASTGVLRTFTLAVDLGESQDYVPKIDSVIAQLQAEAYDRICLVHNAGSIGQFGFTQEWDSVDQLSKYHELNVLSVYYFNSRFLRAFGASRDRLLSSEQDDSLPPTKAVIVNISSTCGIRPFQTLGLYCAGKAARVMHHRVIAAEQAAASYIQVLNYSPGAMDTDMQEDIRNAEGLHPDLAKLFRSLKEQGALIPPEKSSLQCVQLALSGNYETGSHVDFDREALYDLIITEWITQNALGSLSGSTKKIAKK